MSITLPFSNEGGCPRWPGKAILVYDIIWNGSLDCEKPPPTHSFLIILGQKDALMPNCWLIWAWNGLFWMGLVVLGGSRWHLASFRGFFGVSFGIHCVSVERIICHELQEHFNLQNSPIQKGSEIIWQLHWRLNQQPLTNKANTLATNYANAVSVPLFRWVHVWLSAQLDRKETQACMENGPMHFRPSPQAFFAAAISYIIGAARAQWYIMFISCLVKKNNFKSEK